MSTAIVCMQEQVGLPKVVCGKKVVKQADHTVRTFANAHPFINQVVYLKSQ